MQTANQPSAYQTVPVIPEESIREKVQKMAVTTPDSASSRSLTGDSYLASCTNANLTNSNITGNGYHIYLITPITSDIFLRTEIEL